ncbi:hypothetical protein RJ641_000414 [Dillenia turbinata]|uniref:Uncharacterized protein n=1 Tax=Dillenia turbinata TaxID=194707 RepID=A0AAN8WDY0_9MAGN
MEVYSQHATWDVQAWRLPKDASRPMVKFKGSLIPFSVRYHKKFSCWRTYAAMLEFLLDQLHNLKGLGLITGVDGCFDSSNGFRVPHIGWHALKIVKDSEILDDVGDRHVYFVHCYRAMLVNPAACVNCIWFPNLDLYLPMTLWILFSQMITKNGFHLCAIMAKISSHLLGGVMFMQFNFTQRRVEIR